MRATVRAVRAGGGGPSDTCASLGRAREGSFEIGMCAPHNHCKASDRCQAAVVKCASCLEWAQVARAEGRARANDAARNNSYQETL